MNIFDYAMQMEKDGEAYYRQLAGKCHIQGLKKILNMLADDEVGHYNAFEKLKKGIDAEVPGSMALENAKNIFQDIKETETGFDFDVSEIELYNKAIEIEKKSEDFYREKANEVEQPGLKFILLNIAEDEKKHRFLLKNTVDFLSRPKTWIENAEFHHLDEY
jgi:rubrerythrin